MSRTRVKICGITSNQDAHLAIAAGADAIGLNFYAPSPRAIAVSQVAGILENLPAFVSVVGLFVDPQREDVAAALDTGYFNCLQFHGNETASFCGSFNIPYMKAIRVQDYDGLMETLSKYADAALILLDTYVKGLPGGTGASFDWEIARKLVAQNQTKIVLAGGLTPENVAAAIEQVKPFAVDVSSGVESKPGHKDPVALKRFFQGVASVK